jgi:hypothetical protein
VGETRRKPTCSPFAGAAARRSTARPADEALPEPGKADQPTVAVAAVHGGRGVYVVTFGSAAREGDHLAGDHVVEVEQRAQVSSRIAFLLKRFLMESFSCLLWGPGFRGAHSACQEEDGEDERDVGGRTPGDPLRRC